MNFFCGIDVSKYKVFCSILDEDSNVYDINTLESSLKNDVDRGFEILIRCVLIFRKM